MDSQPPPLHLPHVDTELRPAGAVAGVAGAAWQLGCLTVRYYVEGARLWVGELSRHVTNQVGGRSGRGRWRKGARAARGRGGSKDTGWVPASGGSGERGRLVPRAYDPRADGCGAGMGSGSRGSDRGLRIARGWG